MRPNPFEIHSPFCGTRTCDCCDAAVLIAADPPFPGEATPMTLMLPSRETVTRAMQIVVKARERGADLTESEALIMGLFDAYVIHRELLSRAVVYGLGAGADDADLLEETLLVAQDVMRVGLTSPDDHPDTPQSIDLDVGHFVCDLDDEGEDPDGDTICDVPDCPIHSDQPVPTDAEA